MNDFRGKKVVIIGAARQGLALARYLDHQGAMVTLTDHQPAEKLAEGLGTLENTKVSLALGGHPFEILDQADLLCISGGVPLTLPFIVEAKRRGIALSNDSEIFMHAVKATVTGITGSAGKTTTTTLVGRMARAAETASSKSWMGGNIGNPLIESVEQIQPADKVILELSSFQLELMTVSPQIAAILNITPNHLDRHGTMDAYSSAKAHILRFQDSSGTAVLNREDAGSWSLRDLVRGKLIAFGQQGHPELPASVFVEANQVMFREGSKVQPILDRSVVELRGRHNLMNVVAACAIAIAMELPFQAVQAGVAGFRGVPHRLELVREWRGVRWVNGSIATAPERTLADLHSFDEPIVLLLGGRDKNLPWDDLASYIHQRVDHVIVFGEAATKINAALGTPGPGDQLETIDTLKTFAEALQKAAQVACPGDIVLLSPGCTSYDAFRDFEERGDFFKKWVNKLA